MGRINNPLSFSLFVARRTGFVGLALGILYSFGGAIHDLMTTGLNTGTALAFLALVGMPLIFIFLGLVIGFIVSVVYKLVSKL